MVLAGKKIAYECYDIASDDGAKAAMRALAGETSLPPQIANEDVYCGNYNAFDEAVECETLNAFLKL